MKKTVLLIGIAILSLVVLIGTVSIAVGSNGDSEKDGKEEQNPKYEASITIDEQTVEGLSEKEESKTLAPLAKISPDQARTAAEAVVPNGDTTENELENENGALVYEVQVGDREVKIDAGNGKVLQIEKDDDDEESGAED